MAASLLHSMIWATGTPNFFLCRLTTMVSAACHDQKVVGSIKLELESWDKRELSSKFLPTINSSRRGLSSDAAAVEQGQVCVGGSMASVGGGEILQLSNWNSSCTPSLF